MKKIKTIEAVNAYKTLKNLKTSALSEEEAMKVWKDMKALRSISETYDKDIEEAQETLKDDKLEEMQKKLQQCQDLEKKRNEDGYELTKEDTDLFGEVNAYFIDQKKKTEEYFKELAEKEVEVELQEVEEKELFKACKDGGLKFSDMEMLEVVSKY